MAAAEFPLMGGGVFRMPDSVDILKMPSSSAVENPGEAIGLALDNPIGSPSLQEILRKRGQDTRELSVCIVISDNTRPVPYKGEAGILWPIIQRLISGGISPGRILILVATGMHRPLDREEIGKMLDPRVLEAGIRVLNHNGTHESGLKNLGKTGRGSEILISSLYMNSDIKILTGLVESHFMAGASGGRKSVCPGLIGEKSTFIFHGASMLASEKASALVLEGNPCHEESLEMAKTAGVDFIVNVTLDHRFRLTGVFAGDLEKAHVAAVKHLKSYTSFRVEKKYDIVLTHGGFVGINHYQTAKAGVEAAKILKKGGYLLMAADNTDLDVIGSLAYRTTLQLLKLIGVEAFENLIRSPDWVFIPEQWQVQMWNRLFRLIPQDHFYYYSPQFSERDYSLCPGKNLSELWGGENFTGGDALRAGLEGLLKQLGTGAEKISVAYLSDGPYGVPVCREAGSPETENSPFRELRRKGKS